MIDFKNIENLKGADLIQEIEKVKEYLYSISPLNTQPVSYVRWVKIEKVKPNDYNPNSVAGKEMGLLYLSIKQDGYTQPIVTIYNKDTGFYEIVDGFHRYFTCKSNPDILKRNMGYVPIVVIETDINQRMASTVRHNRARGKHSVEGMSSMVLDMVKNGWSDADICNELGMEAEELIKLKHITGFSKLFDKTEYSNSWLHTEQIRLAKLFEEETGEKAKVI